jgi:hypothetical protein
MTKQDEQTFKKLIKEGTLEVLTSKEGRDAVKEGTLEVLTSREGKDAIKEGTLEALRSEEGHDIFTENFAEAMNDTLSETFDDYTRRIQQLESKIGATS